MKKLAALFLTLIVVLAGFTPAVAAAPGLVSGAYNLTTPIVYPGNISVNLPQSMFEEYASIDISKLDVAITELEFGGTDVPGALLAKASTDAFVKPGDILMNLVLTGAPQPSAKQAITAKFDFSYDSGSSTATATWTGYAYPAGTVLGVKAGTSPVAGASVPAGSPYTYSVNLLDLDYLDTQGGTVVPTSLTGGPKTISASITGTPSGFSTNITTDNKFEITSTAAPAAGTYNASVSLSDGTNTRNINVSITITAPVATAVNFANFSNGVTPKIESAYKTVNNAQVLQAGALTLSVPLTSISYDSGATTTALLTYLNTNRNDYLTASPGVSYSTTTTTPFSFNASDNTIRVALNISANASPYTGVSAQLGKNTLTANAFASKVIVYSSGTNIFLGLTSDTFSTPTVTSMVMNDRILYEIPTASTHWTGTPLTQYDTTLNNASYITVTPPTNSLFTHKFVYEGGKHYFQLTANTVGNSYSSSFYTITDNITGGVLTIPLPNATITTAVGVTGNKITGIASGASLEDNFYVNDETVSESIDDLEVHPGDVITLEFDSSFFTWEPLTPNPPVSLTSSLMSAGKITMPTPSTSGPVESVKLVYKSGKSYVEIQIEDTVTSTKDESFSARIYFNVNGSRHSGSYANVKGVVTQEVYEVYDGDDIDMTDHPTIEAAETVRNGTFYIGNDMTIHANLTRGRTYSASSNTDRTVTDTNTLNKYPELEEVLHIEQKNFPSSSTVSFDTAERYYVYDADGNYLGTTDDKVALKSTYYLATKRITFGTAVNETSGSSINDGSGAPSGSGTTPGSYNPNTGR